MKPLPWVVGFLLLPLAGEPGRADEPAKAPASKQAEAFALQVQKLVQTNDAKGLERCLDGKALLERATRKLAVPEAVREALMEGAKDSPRRFGEEVCKAVQKDGGYKLLRVRKIGGETRALFRLITDGGLNYHDMVLEAGPDGSQHIVDVYVVITGELLSQTLNRLFALGVAGDPKLAGQAKLQNEFVDNLATIQRMNEHRAAGRHRELLKEWAKLPPALQKEKIFLIMRVVSAAALMDDDPQGYQKAMDDFHKAFPRDPAVDLVTLDGYFLKKKYAEIHQGLERIDRSVGGDPYVDVLRAGAFLEEGKVGDAKKVAQRALKAEPDLIQVYWTLVTISLHTKEFKETARWLTEIEKKFPVELSDLKGVEEYREFTKSAAYREWLAGRKKK